MSWTLRAARVNRGLTQEDAASAIGVTPLTIRKWEKGSTYPDARQIKKLCELYCVHYDDINFLPNDPV